MITAFVMKGLSVSRGDLIHQTKNINSMGSQVDFCHDDQAPVNCLQKK